MKLHKFSLTRLPWRDMGNKLAKRFSRALLSVLKSFKNISKKANGDSGSLYGYTVKDHQSW